MSAIPVAEVAVARQGVHRTVSAWCTDVTGGRGDEFGMCTDKFGIGWMVNIAGEANAGS